MARSRPCLHLSGEGEDARGDLAGDERIREKRVVRGFEHDRFSGEVVVGPVGVINVVEVHEPRVFVCHVPRLSGTGDRRREESKAYWWHDVEMSHFCSLHTFVVAASSCARILDDRKTHVPFLCTFHGARISLCR